MEMRNRKGRVVISPDVEKLNWVLKSKAAIANAWAKIRKSQNQDEASFNERLDMVRDLENSIAKARDKIAERTIDTDRKIRAFVEPDLREVDREKNAIITERERWRASERAHIFASERARILASRLPAVKIVDVETHIMGDRAPRINLSERGQVALERIRRYAGDHYASAIEDMIIPISERDLCRWAEEEPWMIKRFGYYLVDQRWTFNQVLRYGAQGISGQTTVDDLIVMAKYGQTPGELDIRFRDARIHVDIDKS